MYPKRYRYKDQDISRFISKILVDTLFGFAQVFRAIARASFFLGKGALLFFLHTLKFFSKRPTIFLYTLHLRLKTQFTKSGIHIKHPLHYLLYSTHGLEIFLLSLFGVGLIGLSIAIDHATIDPLQPTNILARHISSEEALLTEVEDTVVPTETEYLSLSGVRLDSEDESAPTGRDDLALFPDALIKPTLPTSEEPISEPNKIHSYTVRAGDTISGIASAFGLKTSTVLWANNLTEYSLIREGQQLVILPTDGVLYEVKKGDTLGKIAAIFSIDIQKIQTVNELAGIQSLSIGQRIILPDAVRQLPRIARPTQSIIGKIRDVIKGQRRAPQETIIASGARLLWPTSARRITQYFSWRHPGVDIAGPTSNRIYAALAGRVIFSGWQRGYGYTILIDHGRGKVSRYAHARQLLVKSGATIEKGDTIALMGSTGRSTGPHLHFELSINGRRVNPLGFIR